MSKLQDMLEGKIPYSRPNINEVLRETSGIYTSTNAKEILDGWFYDTLGAGSYITNLKSSVEFTPIRKDTSYKDFIEKMKNFITGDMTKVESVRIDGNLYWYKNEKFNPRNDSDK